MKDNKRKKEGFTLLEVVISMAIITILSVGIYNGYMIIIKQTKAGEVKQSAALEGKKIVEEIQAAIEDKSFNVSNTELRIGHSHITLEKQGADSAGVYTRFLDKDFNNVPETSAKYTEKITITNINADSFKFDYNEDANVGDVNCKFDISKEQLLDKSIKNYIYDEENKSIKPELEDQDKIILSMYLKNGENNNSRIIEINNSKGVLILNKTLPLTGKVNIIINFNNYKQIESSIPKPVEINVYNKITDVPNIYVEKSSAINVDVKIIKGKMNLYDNRPENPDQADIGALKNIKVEIRDYLKNKNYEMSQDENKIKWEDKDNLFTGYSKKNIN